MQRQIKKETKIKPQKDFPYLGEYLAVFPITNDTIFVYKDTIYTNHELPEDIEIHEQIHLAQQAKIGADKWIEKYLKDSVFRLEQELPAYKAQVRSIKDKNFKAISRMRCATALSSELYGNIISYEEAYRYLMI